MNDIEEAISYIRNTETQLRNLGESWYADYLSDAIELLKEQPEIVRCKDCKHGRLYAKNSVDCEFNELAKDADFFCADGVKKDE